MGNPAPGAHIDHLEDLFRLQQEIHEIPVVQIQRAVMQTQVEVSIKIEIDSRLPRGLKGSQRVDHAGRMVAANGHGAQAASRQELAQLESVMDGVFRIIRADQAHIMAGGSVHLGPGGHAGRVLADKARSSRIGPAEFPVQFGVEAEKGHLPRMSDSRQLRQVQDLGTPEPEAEHRRSIGREVPGGWDACKDSGSVGDLSLQVANLFQAVMDGVIKRRRSAQR